MSNVTAQQVKELRDKTGAGMMDCKTALTETNGDLEAAVDRLRTKGLAKAAKKSGRVAADGLIGVISRGSRGAIVEVNAETDFVARNPSFQEMVAAITALSLEAGGDLDKLARATMPDRTSVADHIKAAVAKIGENMSVRRTGALSVGDGTVASYVHNAVAPGLGKMGVLVGLESKGDAAKVAALGKQLAMHIAAANPMAVNEQELDPAVIARERAVYEEQAKASGKPVEIVAKMVEGRLRKEFFEQVVLMAQIFVVDGKEKVAAVVKAAEKDAGAPIKITGFVRYALGEGIDKDKDDFAAEVAKMTQR